MFNILDKNNVINILRYFPSTNKSIMAVAVDKKRYLYNEDILLIFLVMGCFTTGKKINRNDKTL